MPSQQCKPKGQPRWYAPARDITALLPALVHRALIEWEKDSSPYRWLLIDHKAMYSDDDVGRLAEALADYFSIDCVKESTSVEDAFIRSGLDDIPVLLRMVMFSMIGEEVFGAFWWGIRDVTLKTDDEITCYSEALLADKASTIIRYMKMPPWKRRMARHWDRCRS